MLTIATPNFYVGRLRPVRVVVLHSAQVPCRPGRAEGVQRYLAGASVRASCHYATDPDNTVAGVYEADTAWATPSVNADGIQIEQCGYAEFGSGARIPGRLGDRDGFEAARQAYGERAVWPSWDDPEPQRMIRTQLIPLAVDICRRNGLPATLLEPADLLAGRSGITDHHRCSIAYGGTHWDCGHHYPLATIIDDIRRALAGTPTPTIPGDEEHMVQHFLRVTDGQLKDTIYARYTTGALVPVAYEEFLADNEQSPVVDTTTDGLLMALGKPL